MQLKAATSIILLSAGHGRISILPSFLWCFEVPRLICCKYMHQQTHNDGTNIQEYTVSQKDNCAKLFLSEFRQISTNFDNFWQKDGKEAKIM